MTNTSKAFRLTAIAAALVAGCASNGLPGPVVTDPAITTVPALVPGAAAIVRPALAIERWWLTFDDAALDRLMDEGLARNEDLEAAVARVREAQANLDIASSAQSPSLDLQTQAKRAQQSTVGAMPLPPGVDRRASSHSVQLAAGYELDLWGKLSSATAAARHQLLAAEWARSAVEWGLTARLAEAYFGLAAVNRQIEISRSVRDSREATYQLRRREHAAGAGNEFDLRRAEAELTTTEASLAGLERNRIALETALTLLLGRTPAEIAGGSLPRATLDEGKSYSAALPRGNAADLLTRRPDVRQAEAQLAAANANIEAARAATLPAVKLSGVLGSDARSVSSLFSGPATIWSLAAGITQSLLDGGRDEARVREQHARAEQSLANYRKVIATAVLDVREAYAALDVNQQAVRAERDRVVALARSREIARLGVDKGALSQLDLLDAERNWHQAQLDHVSAYRAQLIGQVAAFKALGGGYTAPERKSEGESRKSEG